MARALVPARLMAAVVLLSLASPSASLIELRTSASIPGITNRGLHEFLATPSNWPDIVASSHSVRPVETPGKAGKPGRAAAAAATTAVPLTKGASVDEIFGAPPVLPLSVRWDCVEADAASGLLDVRSPDGLEGVASDCRMLFEIGRSRKDDIMGFDNGDAATVELTMSYEPRSPLAVLAVPVLALDNALAVKVLLPRAVARAARPVVPAKPPVDQFRELMGWAYGGAGLAHAFDLFLGPSQLLVLAGAPPFVELPPPAQALAALWCASGPIAWVASRVGGRVADLGLVQYGLIEVAGAALISANTAADASELNAIVNALGVQVAVVAAWLYSSQRQGDEASDAAST